MNEELLKIRAEIIKSREEKGFIEKKIKILVTELQGKCDHISVIETDYIPGLDEVIRTRPPRRICLICGIEEDGWGCGYKILIEKPIRTVSREEFFSYRELKPLEMRPVPTE